MPEPKIEPAAVITAVEDYVRRELDDAARYDNRTPLDETGIYDLHLLAARVYALGYSDGEVAESGRGGARLTRAREAARKENPDA